MVRVDTHIELLWATVWSGLAPDRINRPALCAGAARRAGCQLEWRMFPCGLILPVPDGLHNTNTNILIADSLPLLTMLACVPVLRLFARQQKLTEMVSSLNIIYRDPDTLQSGIIEVHHTVWLMGCVACLLEPFHRGSCSSHLL